MKRILIVLTALYFVAFPIAAFVYVTPEVHLLGGTVNILDEVAGGVCLKVEPGIRFNDSKSIFLSIGTGLGGFSVNNSLLGDFEAGGTFELGRDLYWMGIGMYSTLKYNTSAITAPNVTADYGVFINNRWHFGRQFYIQPGIRYSIEKNNFSIGLSIGFLIPPLTFPELYSVGKNNRKNEDVSIFSLENEQLSNNEIAIKSPFDENVTYNSFFGKWNMTIYDEFSTYKWSLIDSQNYEIDKAKQGKERIFYSPKPDKNTIILPIRRRVDEILVEEVETYEQFNPDTIKDSLYILLKKDKYIVLNYININGNAYDVCPDKLAEEDSITLSFSMKSKDSNNKYWGFFSGDKSAIVPLKESEFVVMDTFKIPIKPKIQYSLKLNRNLTNDSYTLIIPKECSYKNYYMYVDNTDSTKGTYGYMLKIIYYTNMGKIDSDDRTKFLIPPIIGHANSATKPDTLYFSFIDSVMQMNGVRVDSINTKIISQ